MSQIIKSNTSVYDTEWFENSFVTRFHHFTFTTAVSFAEKNSLTVGKLHKLKIHFCFSSTKLKYHYVYISNSNHEVKTAVTGRYFN